MAEFNPNVEPSYFLQSSKSSYILVVSDEDGYVSLFDTRRRFPSSSSHQENAGRFNFTHFLFVLLFFFWEAY